MDIAATSSASASAPSAAYSPEVTKKLARAKELAAVITDNKVSLENRVAAWHDFKRIHYSGVLRGLPLEDLQFIKDVEKSDLSQRAMALHEQMSIAMGDADRAGKNMSGAALSFYDGLSEEDQTILFAAINIPVYQNISRMEVGEPTQPFNSVEEWRSYSTAIDMADTFYKTYVKDRDALSPSVQAAWSKIQALSQDPDSARDGSWAREIKKILSGPMDRVELSPAAQTLLLNRDVKVPSLEPDKLGETDESIALMVLEKGQQLRNEKEGKDGHVRERPSFTSVQAQGSIVDVAV